MRKFVNGQYLDMTEEEIAEATNDTFATPTDTERIEALEMELKRLQKQWEEEYKE